MTACEASRVYQIALEHERWGRSLFAGVLSAEEDLDRAGLETRQARSVLVEAVLEHSFSTAT